MEYMYAAMLLHKSGKGINEGSIKKVLEAAGIHVDEAKVKAIVAALDGVDIDKVIKESSIPVAVAPAVVEVKEEKKKEQKSAENEKKAEEQAAAGLGSLFG